MHAHPRVDRHIEGLRALAVLAVVVHHAWPALLPGGFLGVDVFFVISGYLIGKRLIDDIRHERFSFRQFYARRTRRLLPALAVVLVATWCVGWWILDAREFEALGKHTLAAVTFSSNFLLWQEAGYFDAVAQSKPLLHLWSLGIEEQFYLLLPAVLWWGRRGTQAGVAWGIRLGAVSLALFLLFREIHPQASFYLLHARLWELIAGVAIGARELRRAGPLHATTWLRRLLSVRPLVFIGGISYPLYLWHWPLLVFWRLLHPEHTLTELAPVLLGAVTLAWLTKILVEDPIRFGRLGQRPVRLPALPAAWGGLALAGTLGASSLAASGWPARLPPATRALAQWQEDDVIPAWRVGSCFFWHNTDRPFANECTPARRPGVTRVLLWGDSHAAHLYAGLAALQAQAPQPWAIAQWTAGSCPPSDQALVGEGRLCAQRRSDALRQVASLAPETAILAGAWVRYVRGGQDEAALAHTLTRTLIGLRRQGARHLVLVGPGPSWPTSLPADLLHHLVRHRSEQLPRRWGRVDERTRSLDHALRQAARAAGADYLSMLELLCDDSGCLTHRVEDDGRPDLLFRDQDHLTRAGSLLVARQAQSILLPPSVRSETIRGWKPTPSSRPS